VEMEMTENKNNDS